MRKLYFWLKKGTSPDSSLKATKATPLIWAARKSHPRAVKLLIRFKANLDLQDVKGNTALHYACQNNDRKTTLLLVEAGADMSKVNQRGEAPFQLSSFEFFKRQVIQFFNERIKDNLDRRKYIESRISSINLSALQMKEIYDGNLAKLKEWKWQIKKANQEADELGKQFDATLAQVNVIENLRKTYIERMEQARRDETTARQKEARFRELEAAQLQEIDNVNDELVTLKEETEMIEGEISYLQELMESRTSILAPIEMFSDDERIASLTLSGILSLVHADDSEEMEFSMMKSDARDHIRSAVDKFGKSNVGLARDGITLMDRVNKYEKEFTKYKNL